MIKKFPRILLMVALSASLIACNNNQDEAFNDMQGPNNSPVVPIRNPVAMNIRNHNNRNNFNDVDRLDGVDRVDDNISSTKTSVPSDKYPHTRAIIVQEAKFKAVPQNEGSAKKDTGTPDDQTNAPDFGAENMRDQVRTELRKRAGQTRWWPNFNNGKGTNQQNQAPAPAPEQETKKREEKAGTPGPPKEEAVDQSNVSQFVQQVIDLTNQHRQANGLKPLTHDPELSKVAQKKSQDMHQNNYFSHTSPTYGSPFDMMRDSGIEYKTAGENIAQGQRTPEDVVNAWMNSSGHRANILNPDFTHIGVGVEQEEFHWTQMFIGK